MKKVQEILVITLLVIIGHSIFGQKIDSLIIDPEEIATPIGNWKAFYLYINNDFDKNLIKRFSPSDKVYLEIEIDKNGNIVNSKVIKSFDVEVNN